MCYKKLPDLQVFNRLNPAPNLYRADNGYFGLS
jgi:hypothetical protein